VRSLCLSGTVPIFASHLLILLCSSVLAAMFLSERLGRDGTIGCILSLIGSVIIILHAPEEIAVDSVDEILNYAMKPGRHSYLSLASF
jgi:hypothetical protein